MIRSKLHLINAAHVFITVGPTPQEEDMPEWEGCERGGTIGVARERENYYFMYSLVYTSIGWSKCRKSMQYGHVRVSVLYYACKSVSVPSI